jgi:hypothetical protein
VWWGDELIISGNTGLEEVSFKQIGKRTAVVLTISDYEASFEFCPEAHRYWEIDAAFGNITAIKALNPTCELIQISAFACNNCKLKPRKGVKNA